MCGLDELERKLQGEARGCDVFHVYRYGKPSHPRASPCIKVGY
jgi:hypothetical protein